VLICFTTGPNGYAHSCGAGNGPCDLDQCYGETIVVETQENVECNTYLGANTIGTTFMSKTTLQLSQTLAYLFFLLLTGVNASYTYSTSKFITSGWTVGFDLGTISPGEPYHYLEHLLNFLPF
jgi:hypothetical protein